MADAAAEILSDVLVGTGKGFAGLEWFSPLLSGIWRSAISALGEREDGLLIAQEVPSLFQIPREIHASGSWHGAHSLRGRA